MADNNNARPARDNGFDENPNEPVEQVDVHQPLFIDVEDHEVQPEHPQPAEAAANVPFPNLDLLQVSDDSNPQGTPLSLENGDGVGPSTASTSLLSEAAELDPSQPGSSTSGEGTSGQGLQGKSCEILEDSEVSELTASCEASASGAEDETIRRIEDQVGERSKRRRHPAGDLRFLRRDQDEITEASRLLRSQTNNELSPRVRAWAPYFKLLGFCLSFVFMVLIAMVPVSIYFFSKTVRIVCIALACLLFIITVATFVLYGYFAGKCFNRSGRH